MNAERGMKTSSSFSVPRSSLLEYLSRLHRPEHEVEFVEVNAEVSGEAAQALFRREVARPRRRRLRRFDDADFGEAAQDVLVKYRVAAQAHVPKEVARLLIAQALDALLAREPVAPLRGVSESFEPLAQTHRAVAFKELSRHDDVAGARVRVTVLTLERRGQFTLRAAREQVAHGLD